jgi:hypothetical protein
LNFGIKEKMTKWLNPDATTADMGEGMQAYFDETNKVWVFPGEDPAEKAKPVGPPPMVTTPAKAAPQTAPVPSNDPLAAMMAPPPRGPSAVRARSMQSTPNRPGFGGVGGAGPMPGAAPPQFAVFQPAPQPKAPAEEEEE